MLARRYIQSPQIRFTRAISKMVASRGQKDLDFRVESSSIYYNQVYTLLTSMIKSITMAFGINPDRIIWNRDRTHRVNHAYHIDILAVIKSCDVVVSLYALSLKVPLFSEVRKGELFSLSALWKVTSDDCSNRLEWKQASLYEELTTIDSYNITSYHEELHVSYDDYVKILQGDIQKLMPMVMCDMVTLPISAIRGQPPFACTVTWDKPMRIGSLYIIHEISWHPQSELKVYIDFWHPVCWVNYGNSVGDQESCYPLLYRRRDRMRRQWYHLWNGRGGDLRGGWRERMW